MGFGGKASPTPNAVFHSSVLLELLLLKTINFIISEYFLKEHLEEEKMLLVC